MSRCHTSHPLPDASAAKSLSSRDWPAGTGVVSYSSSTFGCASLNVVRIDAHSCFARSLLLSCQNSTFPFTGPCGAVDPPPMPPQAANSAVVASGALLAACGGIGGGSTAPQGPVKGKVLFWQESSSDLAKQLWASMRTTFKEAQPNVELEYDTTPVPA